MRAMEMSAAEVSEPTDRGRIGSPLRRSETDKKWRST